MDLRGARILSPGTTGEIGRALAIRLHTLGTRTALADRDHDVLATVTGTTAVHRPQTGRSVAVPEINLPHLGTGFAARAVVMIRPGAGPALEMVR
ncbi:hypothetical protein [Streptomyces sp. NPDC010273]|uniref:hypothetical protein n=1 Tax=Streptomyces sp. NPDC010273 TaxID=3364829 RepID=UPI0036EDF540